MDSRSMIGHCHILVHANYYAQFCFEMFTGSVIDILFSKKESPPAVAHFTIEGKVLLLKIVYIRWSLFML